MWRYITILMIAALAGGCLFLSTRIPKFRSMQRFRKRNVVLVSFAGIAAIGTVLVLVWNMWNAAVIFLHYLLFWAIADLVAWIYRKLRRVERKRYIAGCVALVFTTLYLAGGWFCAHHVFRTAYQLQTDKVLPKDRIRVVCFSDSHVGATFHWQEFSDYVDEMNAEKPDLVVLPGDFIDDDTSYEDMVKCCEAMAKFDTTYGVFYAFGNHDAGYFGRGYRGYDRTELVANLEKNGVIVLEDDVLRLDGRLCIAGRADLQTTHRADMQGLMSGFSHEDYVLVLDHEPGDYEGEAASGADLVLSGHTHGGQFIPITHFGEYMGVNDRTYGYEKRENTEFIVTSGISNWAFKFKTGCISEYLVIDIE